MRLYLIQHAEAKSKEDDPQRPLTQRGSRDTRKIASYLREHSGSGNHRIVHSGKLRARQTAEIINEYLGSDIELTEEEGLKPRDNPEIWAKIIEKTKDDLIIVGHLPHLYRLVSKLLTGDENLKLVTFQNSGLLCLEQEDKQPWTILWMVIPRVVKAPRWDSLGVVH